MTTHRIALVEASDYSREHYGITYRSAYVYRQPRAYGPTRVTVWGNAHRPNPHPGETRWTDFGRIGGDGAYLDPNNQATDAEVSVLLSPECVSITAQGNGTGHPDSGQVYAPDAEPIRDGDTLVLVYPNGAKETYTAKFPKFSNGHGEAVPAPVERPWVCMFCGDRFATSGAIGVHIAKTHPDANV